MAETLAVVSILAIVAAVAIPNVVSLREGLAAMELDARAQQVYQSVQYNLSALQSSGRTGELEDAVKADANAIDLSADYNTLAAFTGDGHSTARAYRLYALPGNAAAAGDYLVTQSGNSVTRALSDGSYWVELSPATGEVYSVFYTADASSAPSYAEMSAMRASKEDLAEAGVGYYGGDALSPAPTKSNNTNDNNDDDDDKDNPWSDLKLTIVNGEEFYARITGSAFSKSDIFNKVELRVTVTGQSVNPYEGYATWKRTFSASGTGMQKLEYVEGTDEIDIILDSMRDGLSFANLFGNLMPGTDANITVALYYDGEIVDRIVRNSMNTYYETLSEESVETSWGGTETAKVATVANVRQLRNLDLAYRLAQAGITGTAADNIIQNFIGITAIRISDDIDFDGTNWNPRTVSIQSRNAAAGGNLNPLASFKPISLPSTIEAQPGQTGAKYVFDGQGHTLKNFVTSYPEGAADNTGLISSTCVTLRNISMENPKVTGANCTGALVGKHTTGLISNCSVKGTDANSIVSGADSTGGLAGSVEGWIAMTDCTAAVNVTGASYVGGLTGSQSSQASNCTAGHDDGIYECNVSGSGDYVGGAFGSASREMGNVLSLVNAVSGRDAVGGLAGVVTSALSGCGARGFAADNRLCTETTVSGRTSVGGLVGELAGGSVTGCYSSSDVNASGAFAEDSAHGGLIGTQGGGSISNSYSSGTVSGSAQVGGCVGRRTSEAGTLSDSYSSSVVRATSYAGGFIGQDESASSARPNTRALGRVLAQDGADLNTIGGYVGSAAAGSSDSDGSCYLRGTSYNNFTATESYQPSAKAYSELVSSVSNAVVLDKSHPVSADLLPYAFPYSGASYNGRVLEHYGDWYRE